MVTREQQLIDLCFACAIHVHEYKMAGDTKEDVAAWVAGQLRGCGFDTQPVGMSWGVLRQSK